MSGAATELGMGGALLSGMSNERYTPPHIFDALGLTFDLDPCAPRGGVPWVPAARHFSVHDDGLAQPWEGRVWVNPPYGSEAPKWIGRLIEHGNGIALVFARTDAAWGQAALQAADAVCFVAGRIAFIDGSNRVTRPGRNAAASSMLLAFGDECAAALEEADLGVTFRHRKAGVR